MAEVLSTRTVVIVDGNDISRWTSESSVELGSNSEDLTTYGSAGEVYAPTLLTAAFSCSGWYDSDEDDGPRAVLAPLRGTKVLIQHRPEGTGAGLPQDTLECTVTKYAESAPVAGHRTWSLETQPDGEVDDTPQS